MILLKKFKKYIKKNYIKLVEIGFSQKFLQLNFAKIKSFLKLFAKKANQ